MTSKRTKKPPSGLGTRLKLVRESAGIGEEDLSLVAGLSRTHVHCIEVGWITSPKYDTVLILSQVLGVSLNYLVAGLGSPPTLKEIKAAFCKAKNAGRRHGCSQQLREGAR